MTAMPRKAAPGSLLALRCRELQASDSHEAAKLLCAHRVMPPELARTLAGLLHALIVGERVFGVCVEVFGAQADAPPRTTVAVGLSGFISDDYLQAILAAPPADLTVDILEHCRRGDPCGPLLDVDAIARANASAGLTLTPLAWVQDALSSDCDCGDELAVLRMQMFLDRHKGYRLKRILKQASLAERASLLGGGFLPITRLDDDANAQERLLFGLTSEQAQDFEFASAIGLLFTTRPLRLGLSRKQQRVLIAALDELSDDEIAAELGITAHAVNMRWRTIYDKLKDLPALQTRILHFQNCDQAQKRTSRSAAS